VEAKAILDIERQRKNEMKRQMELEHAEEKRIASLRKCEIHSKALAEARVKAMVIFASEQK
jgi:hypothetical protein